MTMQTATPSRAAPSAVLSTISIGLIAAIVLWIAATAARGALLALQVFDIPSSGEAPRNFATPEMLGVAAGVYLACAAAAVITRLTRSAATLPAICAVCGAIVLAGAFGAGSLAALMLVVVAFFIACLVGSAILRRLPPTADAPLVRFPISIALGLGALGIAFFSLAALSLLNAGSVLVAMALLVAVVLIADRDEFGAEIARAQNWRPTAPSWFETIVFALVAGLVTFAVLTAFVPEIQTDATREHLPIAREIWQTGTIGEFFPMGVSRDPVQGHLYYAVAYGLGGATAATLVQTAAGLTAFIGVAALGWLVAGRTAAIAGGAIFATMPIVLWQLGHAFMDLFPVLFMVAAAACVLLWQRDGALPWLVAAGALAGIGFACKVTMGWSIVGLLGGIVLVGRAPWRWRERIVAGCAFIIGTLVIVPWLIRGYMITGDLSGADFLISLLGGVFPELAARFTAAAPDRLPFVLDTATQETTVSYLGQRGLGHAPLDLVRAPWALSFHGDQLQFPLIGRGEIGISLLMLLPLALIGPRTRATAFLAIATLVSYVVWFLTPYQIARHLLPTLAIASALAGIGVASAVARTATRWQHALSLAARAGLIAGCLAVPFLLLPSARATLPVDVLLGREPAEAYVQRAVPSAVALDASSTLLPPETPVAYIGGVWEGPQLYTEARLVYVVPKLLGSTAEEIMGNLDRLGVRHVIWNRTDSYPADWRSPFLSSSFLENHTRILAGDRDAYLFEVLAEPEQRWGTDTPGNLLADPEFATLRKGTGPWTTTDRANVDDGALSLRRRAAISQQAAVDSGTAYFLTISGACGEPGDRVELSLQWLQEDGTVIETATERVLPGTERGGQFLWRRAPEGAEAAVASVAVTGSASCQFDGIALHEAP